MNERRKGRRVSAAALTRKGEKFIGNALPNHTNAVRTLMRALNTTEQDSLSRLCRKLRAADVMKLFSERTHEDAEE